MIRIDGFFLYQVGAAIRPLAELAQNVSKGQLRGPLWSARYYVDALLNKSVYSLSICRRSGLELLAIIDRISTEIDADGVDLNEELDFLDRYMLATQAKQFETVLGAEFQTGQLYLVSPKGGADLSKLTEAGLAFFPNELSQKVPEAIEDATQATRCIAFDLPTAAAFHLHRINELVLRRYYDAVTNGAPRPEKRNIGAYIDAMKNAQFKDQKVFGALAMLKDFHRNPVLHPDDRLDSVDEAMALLGVVNTVMTYMLAMIAPPPLELTSPD